MGCTRERNILISEILFIYGAGVGGSLLLLRQLISPLYQAGKINYVDCGAINGTNERQGKLMYLEQTSSLPSVHHRFHMIGPGLVSGSPLWEFGNQTPELQNGQVLS
jgi:hypothetical protein